MKLIYNVTKIYQLKDILYINSIMSDLKNKMLNNRYILIKEIGSGSFSTVWLVFDIDNIQYYALKIQNTDDYNDARHELSVYEYTRDINSSYLMNIYNAFEYTDENNDDDDDPHVCMVMDLMECSTHELIKTKQHKHGLPFDVVMKITKQILMGIVELHKKNVIHKDIKPENILICGSADLHQCTKNMLNAEKIVEKFTKTKKGKIQIDKNNVLKEICANNNLSNSDDSDSSESSESSDSIGSSLQLNEYSDEESDDCVDEYTSSINKNITIKLADMGHCVLPNTNFPYQTQSNYYLAPELVMQLPFNNSVDMWALGCTVYELLTGKILFESESYVGNTYRHHLYMIAEKLGMFPPEYVQLCSLKDIFFNKRCTCIKGYRGIKFQRPLWRDLQNICRNKSLHIDTERLFIDFMMGLFRYNINLRTTSEQALNHEIFNFY